MDLRAVSSKRAQGLMATPTLATTPPLSPRHRISEQFQSDTLAHPSTSTIPEVTP